MLKESFVEKWQRTPSLFILECERTHTQTAIYYSSRVSKERFFKRPTPTSTAVTHLREGGYPTPHYLSRVSVDTQVECVCVCARTSMKVKRRKTIYGSVGAASATSQVSSGAIFEQFVCLRLFRKCVVQKKRGAQIKRNEPSISTAILLHTRVGRVTVLA